MLLGFKELIDFPTQGSVFPAGDLFGDHFESERSIADPSVKVVRIDGVWTGDDDPRLVKGRDLVREQTLKDDAYRGRRTNAPDDFEPSGPILAKRPALAIGDSVLMYDSTGVGPRNFSTQEKTKAVRSTLKLFMA